MKSANWEDSEVKASKRRSYESRHHNSRENDDTFDGKPEIHQKRSRTDYADYYPMSSERGHSSGKHKHRSSKETDLGSSGHHRRSGDKGVVFYPGYEDSYGDYGKSRPSATESSPKILSKPHKDVEYTYKGTNYGHDTRRERSLSPKSVAERDTRTVFVWQLAARISARDLSDFFSTVGRVKDVRLIEDQRTRRSKGIAYVEFAQVDSIELAVKLTGTRVLGVPIQVQRSQADRNKNLQSGSANSTATGRANPMKLYVGSLDYNITEDMVRPFFEAFGKVEEFKLIKETGTARSQGYGFLSFQRADDAKHAMDELNGFLIAGRPMKVSTVTDRSTDPKANAGLDSDDLERAGLDLTTSSRIALMAKLAEGTGLQIPQAAQSALQHYQTSANTLSLPAVSSVQATSSQAKLPFREELPTPCLILKNVFDLMRDGALLNEIEEDVLSECTRLGGVLHMQMDTRDPEGCVYIKCINVDVAKRCIDTLGGRFFSGRQIIAQPIALLNYIKLFPDSISLRKPLQVT